MSKERIDVPGETSDKKVWKDALKELDAEIIASQTLTKQEKRFLLEGMDELSDDEWQPITCSGEPVSETINKDRG